ncbi:MAG: response regulator [Spirochaetaceae bacterium]|jgi:putative two-component system response regulator|nr:response regulator [Spirochaetaceae bacterium]
MPSLDKSRATVLVVDDVDMNVMILEEILQDEYQIVTAFNGVEALKMLREAGVLPKIILLDVMMPEMTGRELFDILKANDTLRRIPVIFITAENDSESELLAAGAVDFINKPFLPEIVKLRVRNQIALKNYSDSLEQMVAEKTAEATKTLDNALQGLANVIEHRDLESGEHVKRTQLYVLTLVNHLINTNSSYAGELKDLDPESIVKSMALHDVGKIAIPDRILLKPGRLDPEEYEVMKTHTTRGKEIIGELGDINSSLYLRHCEDICFGHHERWDGKGYPRQLSEMDIPLAARLASLADVYDALVCARVYKAAIPYTEAVNIIFDGRGTQFDPVITDALIDIQDEFRAIAQTYS